MKVSIITAAYNSAATIADTLSSVKAQTYPDIEHIIMDGASRDETLAVVERDAPHARCFTEPDDGIYDAMNKGIERATGDLIGILNSDDFYPSDDVIQQVVDRIQREQCDTIYGDLTYVDQNNTDKAVRKWKSGTFRKRRFLYGWMPPHPTFFVRRQVYEQFGVFRTELRTSADYELMLRFLYKHEVSTTYLPYCIVHMRTGGQSNASLRHRIKANKEDRRAWEINALPVPFYTTYLKPMRKITQFIRL